MPTSVFSRLLLPITTASGWRSKLGLAIGTDVQAQDDLLDSVAALSMVDDRYILGDGTDSVTLGTISTGWQTALAQTPTGTWTPTLTNTTNLSASGALQSYYIRVGSYVLCWGHFTADAVSSATGTQLGISVPVASNFTSIYEASGTIAVYNSTIECGGSIASDASNDRVTADWLSASTANLNFKFMFGYVVL